MTINILNKKKHIHPTNRKTALLASIIIAIAIVIAEHSISQSQYYWIPIILFALISLMTGGNYIEKVLLVASLSIVALPILLFIVSNLSNDNYFVGILFLIFLVGAVKYAFMLYIIVFSAISQEKKYYGLIKRYPQVICTKHNSRIKLARRYGYKDLACKKDKECINKNRITYCVSLIGQIGRFENEETNNGNYYITLWDHNTNEIVNADYDIIEIHENKEIDNYDSVILKVVNFLHNDLKRYKPINKVIVKIFNNPNISESTKRLLEERFMKVEYLNM